MISRVKTALVATFTFLKLILKWKAFIWLPAYHEDRSVKKHIRFPINNTPIDIIFLLVDHYEPAKADGAESTNKVIDWCEKYINASKEHLDSDGIHPQHSWFYRYDFPRYENIRALSKYVFQGFGETEFHLHHYHDNVQNFNKTIDEGVKWFNRSGAMLTAEEQPQKKFAYIAGNWALDNGRRDPQFSGVNTEISILRDHNCYADFTFPAFGVSAQPRMVNKIYYATDTPQPKSYDKGIELEVGKGPSGDLMIFQGPLLADWRKGFIETADFESFAPFFSERLNHWIDAHVHVKGRPEWIFIKLHTHGMQSKDLFFEKNFDDMCTQLEEKFKIQPYRLHYVTAREAYNIAKAAEAREKGNPHNFRNYLIKEPVNKRIFCDQPYLVQTYTNTQLKIILESTRQSSNLFFKETPLSGIEGSGIQSISVEYDQNTVHKIEILGEGSCQINLKKEAKSQSKLPVGQQPLPLLFQASD